MMLKFEYFKLPFDAIDTSILPFKMPGKYAYGYMYNIYPLVGIDYSLVVILDFFGEGKDKEELNAEALFGPVICPYLPYRGKYCCEKLYTISKEVKVEDLPSFKHVNSKGDCFVLKNGQYFLAAGIPIKCSEVSDLEITNYYGENLFRLRIVVELIKRNGFRAKLSELELWTLLYKIFRSDYANRKLANEELECSLQALLPDLGLERDIA